MPVPLMLSVPCAPLFTPSWSSSMPVIDPPLRLTVPTPLLPMSSILSNVNVSEPSETVSSPVPPAPYPTDMGLPVSISPVPLMLSVPSLPLFTPKRMLAMFVIDPPLRSNVPTPVLPIWSRLPSWSHVPPVITTVPVAPLP